MPEKDLKEISSYLREVIVGGERCECNQLETFYEKTGIVQMAGFGASEVNTTFSISHQYCNKVGTAGIPLPFNNVKILDTNGCDLTYGQPGRLLITGPCLMNGYYGRADLTEKVLLPDEDGVIWYDTGDYAVIDDDGCLTILDRDSKPVLIKYKDRSETIKLLDVTEVIIKNRNVKTCKLNSYDGKIFMYLVVDDFMGLSEETALDDIKRSIINDLPESHWPDVIIVLKQFPRTQVGKVNYEKLIQKSRKIATKLICDEKMKIIHEEISE
jgi:acyl-CoA synthetase (AMP-forming)/AMP-acid ligase II